MLPAILAAAKAATIAQRLILIGAIIGIALALFGWGFLSGKESCEEKHQAEMVAQAINVAEHTVARSEAIDKVEESREAIKRQQAEPVKEVLREVVRYVQVKHTPCELEPEYVALVNRITELQHAAESRVPETRSGTTGAEELQAQRATTAQLLLAYLAAVHGKLEADGIIEYWQQYDAARYANEMKFYNSLPADLRGESEQ